MVRITSYFKERTARAFTGLILLSVFIGCSMIRLNYNCNDSNDLYSNYKELKKYEKKGIDFEIRYKLRKKSKFSIIAIHGGKIEYLTDEIAFEIANNKYSYYAFLGIKPKNNYRLHITATCFDEPTALKIASSSLEVIAIHGCKSNKEIIHIGGLDFELVKYLKTNLSKAGFNCGNCENPEISGENPKNICNKGKLKKGIQIELSKGIRKKFETNGIKTEYFYKFISVIKKTLSEYSDKVN